MCQYDERKINICVVIKFLQIATVKAFDAIKNAAAKHFKPCGGSLLRYEFDYRKIFKSTAIMIIANKTPPILSPLLIPS